MTKLDKATLEAVAQGIWLVTNGPDGSCAKIVIGFNELRREVVAAVFGDADDSSVEAQAMRERLDTPDAWEGDRWSISWAFEDGYLSVQRVTDMSAYVAIRNPDQQRLDPATLEAAARVADACALRAAAIVPDTDEAGRELADLGVGMAHDIAAAIRSLGSGATGLAVVPREPNMSVLRAGHEAMFTEPWDGGSAPAVGAAYEAMIAAAQMPERPAGDGWQSMETAPQDGSWVLLRGRNALGRPMVPVVAAWHPAGALHVGWVDSGSFKPLDDIAALPNADWHSLPHLERTES